MAYRWYSHRDYEQGSVEARCGALAGSLAPLHPRKVEEAIMRLSCLFPTGPGPTEKKLDTPTETCA